MKYVEMMNKLYKTKEYIRIANKYVIRTMQWLEFQISLEKSASDVMCAFLNCTDKQDLSKMLILLDYATYIPFGKRGQKQVENWLESKGIKMTYEQFKKNRMLVVLAQAGINVDKELKENVEKYCHFLVSDKQDFSQIESVAATVRKIGGELDNYISKGVVAGVSNRNDEMEKILDNMWTFAKVNGKQFDANRFMPKFDQNKPFEPFEKRYFENITELKIPTKEEENVL